MKRHGSCPESTGALRETVNKRKAGRIGPPGVRPFGERWPRPAFTRSDAGPRPQRFRRLLRLGTCSLSLVVLHCAPPPVTRQDWRREDGVEELFDLSRKPLQSLRDLRARARITLSREESQERATMSILLVQPDLFRMEVRGPLYIHLFTAVLQADSLTVLSREGNWKGSTEGLLLQLTGVDPGPYNLRYLLLGLIEPGTIDSSRVVERPLPDQAVVPLRGANSARRVWVDLYRGFVVREDVEPSPGYPGWSRLLRDYRKVGPLYLPKRVVIRQRDVEISLEYEDYVLNEGIAEALFFRGLPPDPVQRTD